ncbi:MAG TPA: response regulator transcription factor [Actinomycetota bacterium]|nr:response regulator transcription factor [Actinomycetota bacterium]
MPRVLVVDDEPRIVSFISRALSAEGLGVDSAHDGIRGLELARSRRYELVVLDLLLPGLDGISVLQAIIDSRPEQRVLILSALSDVDSKVRCLELGAADYLPKPFALAELLARVRARLRQPEAPAAPRLLTAGRVSLDLLRRVADADSGPVNLSEREFLVLQYLMRKAGEVCTREELLADVWGYSFDPGSNVVDVYVGRLRSKLGSELIETVRNVGYRFEAS